MTKENGALSGDANLERVKNYLNNLEARFLPSTPVGKGAERALERLRRAASVKENIKPEIDKNS